MQTLQPVLKHGGLFWDRALLPATVFDDRYHRLQAAIAAAGDDAWLIAGDAARSGDLTFATHVLPALGWALAFVPRSGQPALLQDPIGRRIAPPMAMTWLTDLRAPTDLAQGLAELVGERRLERGRIGGVDLESLPVAAYDAVRAGLPHVRWERRESELAALRPTRHLAERNAARAAGTVVERGLTVARHVMRSGIAMQQATALIDREMRREAAEDVRILIAAGEQSGVQLGPPDERTLHEGNVVLLFVAAQVQRTWVEAAQTLVLGAIPPAVRELSQRAWRAVVGMEANARPGARSADIAAAARRVIGEGPLWESACRYGLGHGIGLDAEELPAVQPDSSATVQRDAALALHVVLHDGPFGAIAGGTYLIQPRESVPLGDHPPLVECTRA